MFNLSELSRVGFSGRPQPRRLSSRKTVPSALTIETQTLHTSHPILWNQSFVLSSKRTLISMARKSTSSVAEVPLENCSSSAAMSNPRNHFDFWSEWWMRQSSSSVRRIRRGNQLQTFVAMGIVFLKRTLPGISTSRVLNPINVLSATSLVISIRSSVLKRTALLRRKFWRRKRMPARQIGR